MINIALKPDLKTEIATSADQWPPAGALVIGGHFQGLGIIRSLGQENIPVYLIDKEFCIGRFSKYTCKFFKCPSVSPEFLFLNFLLALGRQENLEGWVIFPVDDETVTFLAKNKTGLELYYRIPTPPWEITRFASEKKLTYQLAEKFDIPIPLTCYPRNRQDLENIQARFPLVIKPSIKEPFYSLTKKKAIRIDNRRDLPEEFQHAQSISPQSELLVQEMIPGGPRNLYSVGSFFRNGEFAGKVVVRRVRQHPMDFGHATTYAVTVDIPELEHIARRFLRAMGYYGLSEIEFMQDPRDGQYKLIEMNARTWGWHTLALNAGVNLPHLQFQDLLGQRITPTEFNKGIKWFHLVTDIPTVLQEILKGRLSLPDYLNSLKGPKKDAVMSRDDPLPFLAEIFSAPYLWLKRGL